MSAPISVTLCRDAHSCSSVAHADAEPRASAVSNDAARSRVAGCFASGGAAGPPPSPPALGCDDGAEYDSPGMENRPIRNRWGTSAAASCLRSSWSAPRLSMEFWRVRSTGRGMEPDRVDRALAVRRVRSLRRPGVARSGAPSSSKIVDMNPRRTWSVRRTATNTHT